MRVLILANFDVGLYQFRKELIGKLLEDHEVFISLPNGDLIQPLVDMGCSFIDTPVDRRGINPVTDFKLLKQYNNILKAVKPDIVITYTIKPNIYGGLICRLRHVSYAVNITGLGTAFQKKGILRTFVTMLYKIGLKKAKVVYFENIENQQIFIDNRIVKSEQTVLLNGAGVNLEHYQVQPYPQEQGLNRFLFVGRVMKEKGIDELFAVMRRLRKEGCNCVLDVLGGFEEDYEDKIKQYEQEGWLHYHGFQSDVRPFIAQSHCFVLPSWHEGMANTNLECAASGRPVITSNIHGCKEAVEEGVTGFLCEKKNKKSLYKEMKRFLALEPEQKKQMGLAGRKRMEELFDKQIVVKKTIDHLNS